MKTLLITLLLSISIFGQTGGGSRKSVLTPAQKDSIISLLGGFVVDASLSGYETLEDAITTASTDRVSLIIKDTQDLSTDIPSNINLKFVDNGIINFTSACTLKCQIQNIDKEIFTGTTPEIWYNIMNPLWFGADRTGATDSYQAFQDVHDALPLNGGTINIPSGQYTISQTLYYTKRNLIIRGQSTKERWSNLTATNPTLVDYFTGTQLYFTSTTSMDTLLYFSGSNNYGAELSGIVFYDWTSNRSASVGVMFAGGKTGFNVDNCTFSSFMNGVGLKVYGSVGTGVNQDIYIRNSNFVRDSVGLHIEGRNGNVFVDQCHFVKITGDSASTGARVDNPIISNCYFDALDTGLVISGASRVMNNYFDGGLVSIITTAGGNLLFGNNTAGTSYGWIDRNEEVIFTGDANTYISNQIAPGSKIKVETTAKPVIIGTTTAGSKLLLGSEIYNSTEIQEQIHLSGATQIDSLLTVYGNKFVIKDSIAATSRLVFQLDADGDTINVYTLYNPTTQYAPYPIHFNGLSFEFRTGAEDSLYGVSSGLIGLRINNGNLYTGDATNYSSGIKNVIKMGNITGSAPSGASGVATLYSDGGYFKVHQGYSDKTFDLTNTINTTATIDPDPLDSSKSWISGDITATGATLGDYVYVSAPYDLQGMIITAYVKQTNAIKIVCHNSGTVDTTALDLASGTWNIKIRKQTGN